jgi:hypothetical protein
MRCHVTHLTLHASCAQEGSRVHIDSVDSKALFQRLGQCIVTMVHSVLDAQKDTKGAVTGDLPLVCRMQPAAMRIHPRSPPCHR